ncbi:RDD family protein [bacterium AH-315-E10]|nr:RDD family protein [bacterium AH-315-E10]
MAWYYAVGEDRNGPIADEEFEQLVQNGTITQDTLVWQEGMADWVPYSQALALAEQSASGASQVTCNECGKQFPADQVIMLGQSMVCAACKPNAIQKMKESGQLLGNQDYVIGGLGARFVARILDGIIVGVVNMILVFVITFAGAMMGDTMATVASLFANLLSIALGAAYVIFFLGKYQATPGKMALGLKVVMADGSPISYGRATGRFFADILSYILCCIGYIMACFDDERRALHDRICDTRVVNK